MPTSFGTQCVGPVGQCAPVLLTYEGYSRSLSVNSKPASEPIPSSLSASPSLPTVVEIKEQDTEGGSSARKIHSARATKKHKKDGGHDSESFGLLRRSSSSAALGVVATATEDTSESKLVPLHLPYSSVLKRKTKLFKGGLMNRKKQLFASDKSEKGDKSEKSEKSEKSSSKKATVEESPSATFLLDIKDVDPVCCNFLSVLTISQEKQLSQAREQRKSLAIPKIRAPSRINATARASADNALSPDKFLAITEQDLAKLPTHPNIESGTGKSATVICSLSP